MFKCLRKLRDRLYETFMMWMTRIGPKTHAHEDDKPLNPPWTLELSTIAPIVYGVTWTGKSTIRIGTVRFAASVSIHRLPSQRSARLCAHLLPPRLWRRHLL